MEQVGCGPMAGRNPRLLGGTGGTGSACTARNSLGGCRTELARGSQLARWPVQVRDQAMSWSRRDSGCGPTRGRGRWPAGR
jgi:hypothetical protein